MPKHWSLNRDDPRTVVAASVVVLAAGILVATLSIGIPGPFIAVWLVVAAGQLIYALARLRRSENQNDVSGAAQPPQPW